MIKYFFDMINIKKYKPSYILSAKEMFTIKKNIGAIHISNDLTSIERKVMNIVLWNATIAEKCEDPTQSKMIIRNDRKYYRISFTEIEEALEWKMYKNRTQILLCFENLIRTSLKFNILGIQKTNKGKWNVITSLLSSIISNEYNNIILYSFSDPIKDVILTPTLYANLDLNIQKRISSKYTLALWEYLVGEITIMDMSEFISSKVFTGYLSLDDYKNIIAGSKYGKNLTFKDINRKLIKKPLEELASKNILQAIPEYKKIGNKIVNIRFFIKIQNIPNSRLKTSKTKYYDKENNQAKIIIARILSIHMLSKKSISFLLDKYSVQYIKNNINYIINHQTYSRQAQKGALILTSITKNYSNYEMEANTDTVRNSDNIFKIKHTLQSMLNPLLRNNRLFLRKQIRDYKIETENKGSLNIEQISKKLKNTINLFLEHMIMLENSNEKKEIYNFLGFISKDDVWERIGISKDEFINIAKKLEIEIDKNQI